MFTPKTLFATLVLLLLISCSNEKNAEVSKSSKQKIEKKNTQQNFDEYYAAALSGDIEKIKDAVIVLNDNKDLEKISTTVFDFSSQMGYNLELLKNEDDESSEQDEIIEHNKELTFQLFKKASVNVANNDLEGFSRAVEILIKERESTS